MSYGVANTNANSRKLIMTFIVIILIEIINQMFVVKLSRSFITVARNNSLKYCVSSLSKSILKNGKTVIMQIQAKPNSKANSIM